jgi:hypothetical protein
VGVAKPKEAGGVMPPFGGTNLKPDLEMKRDQTDGATTELPGGTTQPRERTMRLGGVAGGAPGSRDGAAIRIADADAEHASTGTKLPATRMYATARALRMRDSASSAGDLITLMQMPNDVTLTAMRHVRGNIQSGMQAADVSKLMGDATVNLGGSHEFSLVLLNEASAFPHGSKLAQTVREGSIILLDCGCTVQGYQSDISRTWIFGEPTPRQREVWNMEARPGDCTRDGPDRHAGGQPRQGGSRLL